MDEPRHGLLRDVIAFVVVLSACPLAIWGGSMLACAGQSGRFTACAMNAVMIGPPLLLLAGVVAGISTRGWTGLLIVESGAICGMLVILLLLIMQVGFVVDWFSGVLALIWFSTPIITGYGGGRVLAKFRRRVRRPTA